MATDASDTIDTVAELILEWKSVSEIIEKTMEGSGLHGIVDCMSKWMSRKYFPHTDVSKVIEKPIVIDELVATINRLVGRSVEVNA